MERRVGIIDRYRRWLPIGPDSPPLTLLEGDTPLLDAPRLAAWVGVRRLRLKVEGANPTGSFKDRGMVVAIARALEANARSVLCASTGNTAASAAAFAARAGIPCTVILPAGHVAAGKLAQAAAHGARMIAVLANFDRALELARTLADEAGLVLVNSVNPDRIAGQRTAAFEIVDALGDAPDVLALPVGNGGNVTSYWRGFRDYLEAGLASRLPRVIGAQAAGAAPFVRGEFVADPDTIATAIRIGRPATWEAPFEAIRASAGAFIAVSDDAILDAHRTIPRLEGVFCEPASAAGVAALRLAVKRATVSPDDECVCVLTGHGLKDAERALAGVEITEIDPDGHALRLAILA